VDFACSLAATARVWSDTTWLHDFFYFRPNNGHLPQSTLCHRCITGGNSYIGSTKPQPMGLWCCATNCPVLGIPTGDGMPKLCENKRRFHLRWCGSMYLGIPVAESERSMLNKETRN
jgi:hypothetical protein